MIIADSRSSGYRLSMQPTAISDSLGTAASASFTVVSLNIHKGLSPLNRRVIVHDVRHALHALAILGEEFGELTKAVLQTTYEPGKACREDVREEAIQTAAMALRFIESLDFYIYGRGHQHALRKSKP